MKTLIWGRLYSDQELQQIALQMNRFEVTDIYRMKKNVLRLTTHAREAYEIIERAKRKNGGLAF